MANGATGLTPLGLGRNVAQRGEMLDFSRPHGRVRHAPHARKARAIDAVRRALLVANGAHTRPSRTPALGLGPKRSSPIRRRATESSPER